jgi:hypothetical protein
MLVRRRRGNNGNKSEGLFQRFATLKKSPLAQILHSKGLKYLDGILLGRVWNFGGFFEK